MEINHKLGLYVSYYISRFDDIAYQNLGFGNQVETHKKIGELLSVNPHTVKNWRDEFDPLFGHRAGWYQRPMSPSRLKIAQALEALDELQIRMIVMDILSGRIKEEPDEEEQLLSIASEKTRAKSQRFILRAPTGKAAEEFFLVYYAEHKKPIAGTLVDCRDLGTGYDFRIETENEVYYIEVKGLAEFLGGILLTDKEWMTAKIKTENYFLCIITNLNEEPEIRFIRNPASRLNAKRNIYTSIQISWSVSQSQLTELND